MKLFGHPLHMMVVHFPAALLPFSLACTLLHRCLGYDYLLQTAFISMAAGTVSGWVALITGLFDLIKITETKKDALNTALIHAGLNFLFIGIYSVFTFIQYRHIQETESMWILITKAFAIGIMFFGNFLGGQLILKYKVAVTDGKN